jgi:predicted NBD/HSP70 family sugar kinase
MAKGSKTMDQYLVLDIGGTFVKYAVITAEGQFVTQGKVPVDHSSEEAMFAALEAVRDAVSDYDYVGVPISMPGRIDTAAGIAHTGGAFSWVHDYPAAERYGAVFGRPATVANDGKCAASAESWQGALADTDSGAVIVLGTGVGGGIVLNGKVWMGASGGAGELSGLLVDFDAMRLPFPQSMSALWANRISAAAITKAYAVRKGLESADGIMLFDAYEAGDEDAKAVLDEFAFQTATGIMSLQATLDLPRYAIGGGISARPETTQLIREAFDELYDPLAAFMPYSKPEIVTCRFGNEANLIGALAFHLA